MRKIETVYLDLDGVLVDLGTSIWNSTDPDTPIPDYPEPGKFIDISIWFGLDDLWDTVAAREEVWSNAPLYQWSQMLYEIVKAHAISVLFLTKPTHQPASWSGKFKWLQRFTGEQYPDVIMTPHKDNAYANEALLIDDNEAMCKSFKECGGNTILFPQPWNSNHNEEIIPYVIERLHEICSN